MSTEMTTMTFEGLDAETKTELLEQLKEIRQYVQDEQVTACVQSIDYEPIQSGPMTRYKPVSFGTTFKFKHPVSDEEITVVITTKIKQKPVSNE